MASAQNTMSATFINGMESVLDQSTTKTSGTVLITGCSSGIGKETAKYFASRGWNVVATMRSPDDDEDFKKFDNVLLLSLDVTDKNSIELAIQNAIHRFGKIDVLVNNAGFGTQGPFETATEDQVGKQFATNVGGVFACIKAILPHFRENQSGVIINVSSVGGRFSFPYFSLYNSTKWAVDGFSESLQYELHQFGIKVKIIEPGVIKTDFYDRSMVDSADSKKKDDVTMAYSKGAKAFKSILKNGGSQGSESIDVSKVILRAANDTSNKLRYTVGIDAKLILFLKWLIPNRLIFWVTQRLVNSKTKR